MASAPDIFTLTISDPATPEALRIFRADVVRALDSGTKAMLVDIDGIGRLESPVIAALIVALRAARERAAVLSLRASYKPVLETLRMTGLDQIFTVVTPLAAGGEPAKRPGRPRRQARIVAVLLAGTLAAGAAARAPASAQTDPAALGAVQKVIARNAGLRSFEASVAVDIHLRSFPYLSEHLDGTTYFKGPDNFEMVFRKVPAMARGFDKLYSDIDDPSSWPRRFDISLVGEKTTSGHRDLIVRLVQKVRGMIDHEDVAIDPVAWRIDAMEWHYYNGGVIEMSQSFEDVGGFAVLAAQHATIRIPYVHAGADAVYSDYKTNVAIDDGVFTREKK
jgi:anti-anti-sigma regulatory factor